MDLPIREEPAQVAGGEEVCLLPVALLAPAEREAIVQGALEPLGEELEERELVVRLDREVPVRGLYVVALGDPPDLVREGLLELLRDVLDDRAREGERELAVGERELRRVRNLHLDVVLLEPLALERLEVDGNDLVRGVEALECPAGARADVEDALARVHAAELEEARIALLAPAAHCVARHRPVPGPCVDEAAHPPLLSMELRRGRARAAKTGRTGEG